MFGYFRIWYSGSYDTEDAFSPKTNRFAFELGLPMSIPIGQKSAWLEVFPSMQFYSTNNNPLRVSIAEAKEQEPMVMVENHLTHSFTEKLWGGVDLRFQYGDRTSKDWLENDNRVSLLGGLLLLGFKPFPLLDVYANYRRVLAGGQ